MAITGLGDTGEREHLEGVLAAIEAGKAAELFQAMGRPLPNESQLPELVAGLRQKLSELPPPAANLWPALRRQLEAAALIEAEGIPGVGVPFLRFHPTLAPMLWAQLDEAERTELSAAHRQRYYALSGALYREDSRNPHQARAIAWRELPNLLHAVHAALDAGDPDAGDFADNVNKFLGSFGLKHSAESLAAKAQAAASDAGSQAWFLAQSNRGEQLLDAGQVAEAGAPAFVVSPFQGLRVFLCDPRALPWAGLLRTFGAPAPPPDHAAPGRLGLPIVSLILTVGITPRPWISPQTTSGCCQPCRYGRRRSLVAASSPGICRDFGS